MPYVFYHILHLISLIAFVSSVSLQLKGDNQGKAPKIVTGVSGLILLISGMGLLARIGNSMDSWVIVKLVIWLAVMILVPVTAKRFPGKRGFVFNLVMLLFAVAIYAVSTKLQ